MNRHVILSLTISPSKQSTPLVALPELFPLGKFAFIIFLQRCLKKELNWYKDIIQNGLLIRCKSFHSCSNDWRILFMGLYMQDENNKAV
jgi:hypothetical protein